MKDKIMDKTDCLNRRELSLAGLSLITGIIHIYVGYTSGFDTLTLAGLGFVGGTGIFLSGYYRNLTVTASIPYTAIQFVFYYQSYGFNLGPLAAIDKTVQLLFIITGIIYLREKYSSSESLKNFLKS
jgi:hypothetical protein